MEQTIIFLNMYLSLPLLSVQGMIDILFITALVGTTGHDQQVAIFLHHHHQPSNGPIRAKQITQISSVIG
jgi:hypothetical protein